MRPAKLQPRHTRPPRRNREPGPCGSCPRPLLVSRGVKPQRRSRIHGQDIQDIIRAQAPQREQRYHLIRAEGAEALRVQHGLLPQAQV